MRLFLSRGQFAARDGFGPNFCPTNVPYRASQPALRADQHQLGANAQRRYRSLVCKATTLPKSASVVANTPWTDAPEQVKALQLLKEKTKDKLGQIDEDMLKWFLRDREFDVDEAADKLEKVTKWRDKVRPDALSEDDVFHQISTGKGYVHDHLDKQGRPVLVVRVAKHFPNARGEPEASQKLCAYLMETALQKLPPNGETVLGIFDFEGAGPQNIDLEFAKFLTDMFFSYYPKRLGQVLMVDSPWIFQPPWQVIKPLLKKYAALVKFCSAEDVRNEYFTEETVPQAFKR